MPPPARIAIVQDRDDGLPRLVGGVPGRPSVRIFDGVIAAFAEIVAFAPDTLFVDADSLDPEQVGALRSLAGSIDGLRFVLVTEPADEVALAPLAERLSAHLLVRPLDRRRLAAVLSMLGVPPGHPGPDTFLDLAKGVSDELNNPLLFVLGHLQLLETLLDPQRDLEALEQLHAARRGLDRIATTMDRIRTLGRARVLREPADRVDLIPLSTAAWARLPAQARSRIREFVPPAFGPLVVRGDERLLAEAIGAFVAVGAELAALADAAALVIAPTDRGVRLRLELSGLQVGDWQLPRAFEPYHLNRVLRGTPHGLALFLVQTVVHAHGGQAVARRRDDGTVLLDLLLPAADDDEG